jgi:hypothetical protein
MPTMMGGTSVFIAHCKEDESFHMSYFRAVLSIKKLHVLKVFPF